MTRLGLTGGALVTSVLLASDPVAAQSPSDADKIERLERQVNLLQKQLTALQGEIRQTKKKTEPTHRCSARPERDSPGTRRASAAGCRHSG
jgi:hypothetical protein